MAKTKIALLYERLSKDDELQGESFSIQNQDAILALPWPGGVQKLQYRWGKWREKRKKGRFFVQNAAWRTTIALLR